MLKLHFIILFFVSRMSKFAWEVTIWFDHIIIISAQQLLTVDRYQRKRSEHWLVLYTQVLRATWALPLHCIESNRQTTFKSYVCPALLSSLAAVKAFLGELSLEWARDLFFPTSCTVDRIDRLGKRSETKGLSYKLRILKRRKNKMIKWVFFL